MSSFGIRLRTALGEHGPLCVGIDPHVPLLSAWGLPVSAEGAREFGLRVVDAAAGRVGVVKPQVAFFERYGSAGFAALEDVIRAARGAGLLVIADGKRGDLGTSMDGYGDAWLRPGAALEVDALTVNAFQGLGVMAGALAHVDRHGKGVFVLAATSNPEGVTTQTARLGSGPNAGETVSGAIVRDVSAWNAAHTDPGGWGSVGLVIGATVDWPAAGMPETVTPPAPILAPGFGFQGVTPDQLARRYGANAPFTIASESRSVLAAGPDGIRARIGERADLYRAVDGTDA